MAVLPFTTVDTHPKRIVTTILFLNLSDVWMYWLDSLTVDAIGDIQWIQFAKALILGDKVDFSYLVELTNTVDPESDVLDRRDGARNSVKELGLTFESEWQALRADIISHLLPILLPSWQFRPILLLRNIPCLLVPRVDQTLVYLSPGVLLRVVKSLCISGIEGWLVFLVKIKGIGHR